MPQPVLGNLYDPTLFSNINNTFHTFLIFDIDIDGNSLITVQPQFSSTIVKHASFEDANPSTVYFVEENSKYKVLTYSNAAAIAIYYLTPNYIQYLNTKISDIYVTSIPLSNDTYNSLFIYNNNSTVGHVCGYLWTSNEQTFIQPDTLNIQTYLSSITGSYDIRLLISTDTLWYDTFNNTEPPPQLITITSGSEYDKLLFTTSEMLNNNMIYLSIDPANNIIVNNQLLNTDGPIKKGLITNSIIPEYYYFMENNTPSTNLVIIKEPLNVNTITIYIDKNARKYLNDNCYILLPLENDTYLFICRSPLVDYNNHFCMNISNTSPNLNSMFDTTNISSYINGIGEYNVKILNDISLLTADVLTGICDAIRTSILMPTTFTQSLPKIEITTSPNNVNLIYAKSLYENMSSYIDVATTRLNEELNEEIILNTQLSIDDGTIFNDLNSFINNNSVDITTKLQTLLDLQNNLTTYINNNKELLANNSDLNTLLQSDVAIMLTNNILLLKETIFNAIKFLMDNGRYGPNNDIIYLISKTKI
jgi:hypothetical protein